MKQKGPEGPKTHSPIQHLASRHAGNAQMLVPRPTSCDVAEAIAMDGSVLGPDPLGLSQIRDSLGTVVDALFPGNKWTFTQESGKRGRRACGRGGPWRSLVRGLGPECRHAGQWRCRGATGPGTLSRPMRATCWHYRALRRPASSQRAAASPFGCGRKRRPAIPSSRCEVLVTGPRRVFRLEVAPAVVPSRNQKRLRAEPWTAHELGDHSFRLP